MPKDCLIDKMVGGAKARVVKRGNSFLEMNESVNDLSRIVDMTRITGHSKEDDKIKVSFKLIKRTSFNVYQFFKIVEEV